MKRIRVLFGTFTFLVITVFSVAGVERRPWHLDVVIFSPDESDRRLASTRGAIGFWNRTLLDLKLRVRLIEVNVVHNSPMMRPLENYARRISQGAGRLEPFDAEPNVPAELIKLDGDIVILLSKQRLMSFAWPFGESGKYFIAIRSDFEKTMNQASLLQNVVAHELGHALGLTHNSDTTTLMCGPCRTSALSFEERGFFRLLPQDQARLLSLYRAH